jgi:protein-S-isoprenylcysteine O-methyltransferase Ste14
MRILPPRLVMIFVAAMIAVDWLLPGIAVIAPTWRWAGLVPMAGGIALTIAAARQFDRAGTNIRTFDEPTLLVTDGFFRFSRNPMYLGFVLFLAGLAVFLGTLLPMLMAVVFAVVADRCYIAFEERAMRAKFGEAYAGYAARTRRWI